MRRKQVNHWWLILAFAGTILAGGDYGWPTIANIALGAFIGACCVTFTYQINREIDRKDKP